MQENPRGILVYRDEIAGLLNSFNKYRNDKGDDRQFFLEAHSGGVFSSRRKGEGSVYLSNMFLSIYGTTQPEVAQRILLGPQDGLTQRFSLMVWPDARTFGYADKAPNRAAREKVDRAFQDIYEFNAYGITEPVVFYLDAEARSVFRCFQQEILNQGIDAPDFRSHIGKYDGLFVRLSLVHWFMRTTCTNKHEDQQHCNPGTIIDAFTARAVRDLIMGYLLPHARKIYGHLDSHPGSSGGTRVGRWIVKNQIQEFKWRDIQQQQFSGLKTREDLEPALDYLENVAGWVVSEKINSGPRGGRPGMKYVVNPMVLSGMFE
ncbi:MAG TPA: DUF3987 domain-containing protein [Chromatiaceae bacterium]|nr:DUF3987 domain-containing protein [Chromatiaceae bacterium]